VGALLAQRERRRLSEGSPRPLVSLLAGLLFIAALSVVPIAWGGNAFAVWMLFVAPLLAGGSGAVIRPMVDRLRGSYGSASAVAATLVLGLVAGGISGVLFVTAQLTGDPTLTGADELVAYAQRSIPFAVGVGFVAGLTSDAVFGKLLGLNVVRPAGIDTGS
jgi:Na+/citrate or Na+/malate symporter